MSEYNDHYNPNGCVWFMRKGKKSFRFCGKKREPGTVFCNKCNLDSVSRHLIDPQTFDAEEWRQKCHEMAAKTPA